MTGLDARRCHARVKVSARLQLVIVHYHLRPGGVRRVIEQAAPHLARRMSASVLLATGEAPDDAWLRSFRQRLSTTPVEVRTLPAFGYISEQRASPAEVRRQMRVLFARIDDDAVVWTHNPSLGRNLLLIRELVRACAARRIPLIAHQHDWWFENRWQRWPELRRCGFRTLRAVAETVLPASPHLIHATINREDTALLQKHFPGRVHWLPNLVEPAAPAHPRTARRWLREKLASTAPVWLAPCRLLRRKNIAEALLLTRWLRPEAILVTTGGVSSADEKMYAEKLENAARQHGWPLRLGLLARDSRDAPSISEIMAASEAILLTSIQEGFGLAHLEAAAAARPLITRRLPNIAPDLAGFGFRFPQSYDDILIAPGLFDWQDERRRQEKLFRTWLRHLPRSCRRWAGEPALLARKIPQPAPFSRLTLTAQIEVLSHPADASWKLCAPLNAFLATWKKRAAAGRLQATPWPRSSAKWLSGPAYAARFAEIARSTKRHTVDPTASLAAQDEFLRARLDSAHQFPLLWTP